MIICRNDHERHLFHGCNVHSFVKRAGLHSTFPDACEADEVFLSSKSLRNPCSYRNRNHCAEMTDHCQFVVAGVPSMDIAVASAHWTEARAEVGARNVDQRFPECRSPGLVSN